jgi:sodium transport system permease protein
MTVMFTRSARKTLLLRFPNPLTIPAAVLLAVALHPAANVLQTAVMKLYPVNEQVKRQLEAMLKAPHNFWAMILAMAVIPAICEELAFRGFILSGLRRMGHKRRAILLSSFFFALAHAVFQQSLIAAFMGVIIGYLAVQTGSLLPCMLFHMTHNGLALASSKLSEESVRAYPALEWLVAEAGSEGYVYQWHVVAAGGLIAAAILLWLRTLPYAKTAEEALQEAIDNHGAPSLAQV